MQLAETNLLIEIRRRPTDAIGNDTGDHDPFSGNYIGRGLCVYHAWVAPHQAEVVEAAKKASLHDFIMTLPQGYDTPVGELGETLFGGERQRIGLARAFLHQAPLLLLDEPTSNLDSLNEGIVLKALKEAQEGRTVILVSHRKSTLAVADRSYSVENGRLS